MYDNKTPSQQLADYILKNLKKGYTLDSLRFSLVSQGYSKISVENAIELANKKLAEHIQPIKEKPTITYKIIKDDDEPVIVEPKKESFWDKVFG
ncbi:hypothetical protein CMI38_00135 [Candidatus Pacearchaeota archaeon]|nr:hypothetical protein [Candidatus Pacearchaeota archaeon]|tara:strand:- start:1901 stop:2182 length:282 start_codon:yes stop_codon:yes gene_type:complete